MRTWIRRLFRRDASETDCHEVAQILQAFLDGELGAKSAGRIAPHLEACRRCGLDAETYRRIKASLADKRPHLPSDSVARLREFATSLVDGTTPLPS